MIHPKPYTTATILYADFMPESNHLIHVYYCGYRLSSCNTFAKLAKVMRDTGMTEVTVYTHYFNKPMTTDSFHVTEGYKETE